MSDAELRHELLEEIDHLRPDQWERVLQFARGLKAYELPLGIDMQELRRFHGSISEDDAEEMNRAIEDECERVDPEGW